MCILKKMKMKWLIVKPAMLAHDLKSISAYTLCDRRTITQAPQSWPFGCHMNLIVLQNINY